MARILVLALLLAADHPDGLAGLVTVAAPLKLRDLKTVYLAKALVEDFGSFRTQLPGETTQRNPT